MMNIAKREVKAFLCEIEQEHINNQGLHYNVDYADDGESHCDETHVDDHCKVRCGLVNPATTDGFGIINEHMHVWISHHMMDEHYGNETCEITIDCGNMINAMFDE